MKTRIQYFWRLAKIAVCVALLAMFSVNLKVGASAPKPDCAGPSCSGACSTGGGNCCATVGDDDTCMCLSVNSTC